MRIDDGAVLNIGKRDYTYDGSIINSITNYELEVRLEGFSACQMHLTDNEMTVPLVSPGASLHSA